MDKNEQSLITVLRIIRSENIGSRTFKYLLNLYGSPESVLEALPSIISRANKKNKAIKIARYEDVLAEIEHCDNNNIQLIPYCSEIYPKELSLIEDAPPVIAVKGNIQLLKTKKIAIIGARNASFNACRFTEHLARELSATKLTIVSGLARGIDTEAHKGSIEGGTIAIVAGGIDHIYPPENKNLHQQIIEKGLIISEQPYGSVPKPENFPQRNRIISGLSKAVIVVEAGLKSGSLITAKFALEQGKEVMAVPGFPLDPRSQGTNLLIKQGAFLVENSRDIIEILNMNIIEKSPLFTEPETKVNLLLKDNYQDNELSEARNVVLEKLSSTPISIEELFLDTNIPLPLISTIVLELELTGEVERLNGSKLVKIYKYQDN